MTAAARNTMRANRGRDTGPEMAVRRLLHRGLRYQVDAPPLRPTPTSRPAVLAGGAVRLHRWLLLARLWRALPDAEDPDGLLERQNRGKPCARHRHPTAGSRASGPRVMRVWEHTDPEQAADAVERAYRQSGFRHPASSAKLGTSVGRTERR